MPRDITPLLWLLKLGALLNAAFLAHTFALPAGASDAHVVLPARIFFAVSAWRCLFPNRYEGNVVFHDTVLSSGSLTRVLATCSEVTYIYQFAYALQAMDPGDRLGIRLLAGFMVVAVVVSQGFVWTAILTGRRWLYVFEESGWWLLFLAHTLGCAWMT